MLNFPYALPARPRPTDFLTKLAIFLLLGFSFFGKPFSYVAIPLGSLFLLDPRPLLRPFYAALTERRNPLTGLSWALLLSLLYGIAGMIGGILSGYNTVQILQIFTFILYPFYLFGGIWAGINKPTFIRKYVRFFAWFGAFCTPINFLLMHRTIHFPGFDDDTVFLLGSGPGVLLGIFAFETNLLRYWFPIATYSFWLIANQVRADWLGYGIALTIWGAATKKLGRVLGLAGAVALLLIIGFVADVRLPPVPGRGGELSARETISRAVASVSPELAEEYGSKYSSFYGGTVGWRTKWWTAIRAEVLESPQRVIFGLGYGYPIRELVPGNIRKSDIRSPHNIFYFALAYSGLIGVTLFFWLQISLLAALWRTYKQTGQIFGVVFYVSTLVGAFFGNFLETPQGAIPTYLLTGFALAELFTRREQPEVGVQAMPPLARPRSEPVLVRPAPVSPGPTPTRELELQHSGNA